MPYYSRPTITAHFTYEEHDVLIFKAFRGATHCKVEHKPREHICNVCKGVIAPELVFLFSIDGVEADIECGSEEEAEELARVMIEDEMDDDDEDAPAAAPPPDEEDRDARGSGKKVPVAPPPDRKGAHTRPVSSDVLRQMQKLGWVQRAMAIIRANPKTS